MKTAVYILAALVAVLMLAPVMLVLIPLGIAVPWLAGVLKQAAGKGY